MFGLVLSQPSLPDSFPNLEMESVFLKPLVDGVGGENADSLLLPVADVEHLEAARPQQGLDNKGYQ